MTVGKEWKGRPLEQQKINQATSRGLSELLLYLASLSYFFSKHIDMYVPSLQLHTILSNYCDDNRSKNRRNR